MPGAEKPVRSDKFRIFLLVFDTVTMCYLLHSSPYQRWVLFSILVITTVLFRPFCKAVAEIDCELVVRMNTLTPTTRTDFREIVSWSFFLLTSTHNNFVKKHKNETLYANAYLTQYIVTFEVDHGSYMSIYLIIFKHNRL
jgi:hypothetical protein